MFFLAHFYRDKIMKTHAFHVTIIGAGIGGLCLAQYLKQHNISFDVYERDAALDSRRQGYRLRIDGTGQQGLAACLRDSLHALVTQTASLPSSIVNLIDTQHRPVTSRWVDDWRDDRAGEGANNAPDIKVDRQILREILLTGIGERVHFGKRFVRFEEVDRTSVRGFFEDGSVITSDVIVGADGIHSRVRDYCFPDAIPVDTGDVCVYGKTLLTEDTVKLVDKKLQDGTSVIFDDGLAVVIDAMRFNKVARINPLVESDYQDYVYWALIGKRARFGLRVTDDLRYAPNDLRNLVAGVTDSWSVAIKTLLDLADTQALTLMPVRATHVIAPWNPSRITALGDAIHAMSPASGLGANSAIFDAATLGKELSLAVCGKQDVLKAIAEYEAKMRTHSFTARLSSERGAEQLFGGDAQ
jgi:2-polyprenyl-6-methoxyphenol hydroxylase-like FAD-dependent oxidoreductase